MTVRTAEALRETEGYKKAVDKIKGYPKGFEFTISYHLMTAPQKRAMIVIVRDMMQEHVLESIAIGESFESLTSTEGIPHEETFRRI